MGTEVIGAPELSLNNLKMVMLFVDKEQSMSGQKACGLMGLSNNPNWKNFLEVAVAAGQLSDSQFAFQLKGPSSTTLFYAGSSSFPNTVTWFPVVRNNYWAISLTNTIIDSKTYAQPTGMQEAVLDTGASQAIIASNAYEGLIADSTISAKCQLQQGYMICPCNGTGFPDVYFTSNNYKMKVTQADYLVELSGSSCMLGFLNGNYYPFVVLGDVFLRDYFFALDKTKNQLGLYGPGLNNQEKGFLQRKKQ